MDIPSFPDGILHNVSSFLSALERALFCISITGTSNGATTADPRFDLMQIDGVDFADINQNLATRLSDEDLHNILKLVDAVHNLKTLKLSNCVRMTGRGLEPLRGSTLLQHLDFSITKDNNLRKEAMLCVEAVTPIIDSILERRENVGLLNITFPKKWEEEKSEIFVGLKQRYGQFFIRGLTHC